MQVKRWRNKNRNSFEELNNNQSFFASILILTLLHTKNLNIRYWPIVTKLRFSYINVPSRASLKQNSMTYSAPLLLNFGFLSRLTFQWILFLIVEHFLFLEPAVKSSCWIHSFPITMTMQRYQSLSFTLSLRWKKEQSSEQSYFNSSVIFFSLYLNCMQMYEDLIN